MARRPRSITASIVGERPVFEIGYQECKACIPPKVNRTEPASYSKRTYKKRNLIERCIGKLKQFRHVCTRFDRIALNYLAMAKLAAVRLWLRHYESAA